MKKVFIFALLLSLMCASFDFTQWLPAKAQSIDSAPRQAASTATPSRTPGAVVASAAATAATTAAPTTAPAATQAPTAAAATPTSSGPAYARPLIRLVSNSYDARKAYAGGKFTLTVTLENVGQKDAFNTVVTFTDNNLQPLTNGGVVVIGQLGAGSSVEITQDFFIKSSIAVYQTTTAMAVEYKDAGAQPYTQTFQLPVSVYWLTSASATPTVTPTLAGRPRVIVTTYTLDQPTLQPGSSFTLTLNIQNLGTTRARNTALNIGVSASASGTTSSANFLPVGSSNLRVLGDLDVQQTMQLQQGFVVSSSLTPGAYPITLTLSYKDDANASWSDDQIITLLVYLVPNIEVSFYEDVSAYTVGTKGNLPIQVVNMGSSSVLLGNIAITAQDAALANSTLFVGTVDSGSTFTMDTDFTPTKAGVQTINVAITYQDNFKNQQTIKRTLQVNVNAAGQQGAPGVQGTPGASTGAVATQIAAARAAQSGSSNDIWQIILRFIRGMIGFDSAATTTTSSAPSFNFSGGMPGNGFPSGSTATPAR